MRKQLRMITAVVLLVLVMVPNSGFAAEKPINVTVDGVAVQWTDGTPYMDENNRTMVPLRAIGEALGLEVQWNQKSQMAVFGVGFPEADAVAAEALGDLNGDGKADAFLGGMAIGFTIGHKQAVTVKDYYNFGSDLTEDAVGTNTGIVDMDTAAVNKNGRTYAPVRYLAEFFGGTVTWNQKTNTVVISSEPPAGE